jgi:hypothetical protein
MNAMSDKPDPRSVLVEKIRSGAVPLEPPLKVWGGPGRGGSCDGCDQQIRLSQIEYEIILPKDRFLHLHIACFGLWEGIRRRRGLTP